MSNEPAEKTCPYCAEEISIEASVCPECDEPLGGRAEHPDAAPSRKKWYFISFLVLMAILGALAVFLCTFHGKKNPSISKVRQQLGKIITSAEWSCEEQVVDDTAKPLASLPDRTTVWMCMRGLYLKNITGTAVTPRSRSEMAQALADLQALKRTSQMDLGTYVYFDDTRVVHGAQIIVTDRILKRKSDMPAFIELGYSSAKAKEIVFRVVRSVYRTLFGKNTDVALEFSKKHLLTRTKSSTLKIGEWKVEVDRISNKAFAVKAFRKTSE